MGASLVGPLGCSSASQASAANGPVYSFEAGVDAATDHLPDGHFVRDALLDRAVATDAGPDARGDATMHDANAEGAANEASTDAGADGASDAVSDGNRDGDGDGASDGATEAGDGGLDGGNDGAADSGHAACPTGSGTITVVGGGTNVAFGTQSIEGAAFAALTSFANEGVEAAPAVATVGSDLVAVFPQTSTTYLESTLYKPGASAGWRPPTQIPIAGADAGAPASGAPSLGGGNVVYRGSNALFYRGIYGGSAWGTASDPVGGSSSTDTGPSAPSAAFAGGTLYVAFDGTDHGLYVDSSTGPALWSGAQPITGAGVESVPPTLLALQGGSADLMLVYEDNTLSLIYSTVHTAGAALSSWSQPVEVDANAMTAAAVSVAPTKSGGAVMTYLGTDDLFYFSLYTPGASTPWTVPAAIDPSATANAVPPSVATGVCGFDAVATIVQTTGVEVLTLTGTTWSTPILINGTASTSFATVGTLP